jgi:SAM-dependent methyltransferase
MNNIHSTIDNYYTNKIKKYGATPQGVDWNGNESQTIRFKELTKIINQSKFSLSDIGCGYGKLSEYLNLYFKNCTYTGYDLSLEMIKNAKLKYANSNINFLHINSLNEIDCVDYSIASGIFSVKLNYTNKDWLSYIIETLKIINNNSSKGFSFNMLTKYSDLECMKDDLYYADPLFIFDYCKKNFSRNISLVHDYNLYEFTILVRKD